MEVEHSSLARGIPGTTTPGQSSQEDFAVQENEAQTKSNSENSSLEGAEDNKPFIGNDN